MMMGLPGKDLARCDSFQITCMPAGMLGVAECPGAAFNSAVVVPGLKLDGTGVVIMRLADAAHIGQSFPDILYTKAEKEEIGAFTNERRRHEKLAGKLAVKILAHEAARRWFGVKCADEIQVLSPSTPPSVSMPDNARFNSLLEKLYFSLSHDSELVCAAVACHPVGIDIEKIQTLSEETVLEICEERIWEAMAKYQQRTSEAGLTAEELPIVVFTQKEAVLKAAGVGIMRGLAGVELSSFALGAPVDARYNGSRYKILSIESDGFIFSLAHRVEEDRFDIRD